MKEMKEVFRVSRMATYCQEGREAIPGRHLAELALYRINLGVL